MKRRVSIRTPASDAIQFHRLAGREALSQLYSFDLDLLGSDNAIDPNAMLGKSASVAIKTERGGVRYLDGIVTRFGLSREDDRHCFYRMQLRPWLWLATRRSDFRIFQDQSVPEIITAVLERYGYPLEQKLSRDYRRWDYCVQYGESDFDFISRLCEHEGLYYFFRHEEGQHVLVFADDIASSHGPLPGGEELRFHVDEQAGMTGGFDAGERIYEWAACEEVRSGRFLHDDYDDLHPKADLSQSQQKPSGHDHDRYELYEWPGGYTRLADGEAYAAIRNEEQLSERSRASGRSNRRDLAPGFTMRLAEHPRTAQNRQYLLLGVSYDLQENLQATEGAKASEGSVQRFAFDVQPTSNPWRPRRTTTKPRTHGPQTAVVVGPSGEEIWTDQYGRIKVQFHWDRIGQNNENSSCWMRVSSNWAGANFGEVALPRIGQEVIVDFLNGDPDYPVVIGRVHNADRMPAWALPHQKHLAGYRSRELGGGERGNHLALDDTSGKVQAQLKSDHLSSSISLGHIGRIEDTTGRQDDRGQGFELRTDGHGAIRARAGLLVTTESRPNAQAHITDMLETVARLAQGRDLHEGLSQMAQEARAHDSGDQDEVARELKEQNDAIRGSGVDPEQGQFPEFRQPHLTLASPAGIQATAHGSTHVASLGHNAFTSGAHTSVSAGKSLLASARDAVRLFACRAGIRLIAGSADIDVQALRNSINLLGRLNIKLEAERITITAKEEVLIAGGSSFSRWNAQGIVHGTSGLWREHAATHSLMGPARRTPEVVNRDAKAAFDQEVVFHHLDEKNTAAARQVFRLTRGGESPPPPDPTASSDAAGLPCAHTNASGATTGTDGTTQLQRSDGPEIYRVCWMGRKK
ncbi:type VI secretion system Vgr family protein [Variovorax sp. R-27]|uniref:type VI secretion system Vgr family protein n=1 Tax=Variovorax sp. R-27 TaxID=3404058 RepID=UPI003CE69B81